MNLSLTFAMSRNPRTEAILDGRVRTPGIDLITSELQAPDIFWRQLRFAEFDVSEMSLSSLLMLIDRGRTEWTAIPVFHDRRFFHSFAMIRPGVGIERPEDLRGRHVGVPDYQQTAALWTRAALLHDFGVQPQDMVWHMERGPALSHGGGVGFEAPQGVELHYVPEAQSIGSMLIDGQLDAAIVYEPALLLTNDPTAVDRSPLHLPDDAATWLFADRAAECQRLYDRLEYVPANHCVVVRTSVLEEHPWVALNLYEAFEKSKRLQEESVRAALSLYALLDAAGAYGADGGPQPQLYPYGVERNKDLLAAIAEHSVEQGLTSRPIQPSEFLAPSTLDL